MNYKHLSFLILFLSSLFYADESLNASELECLPDAKVVFWAKGNAYLNGVRLVDRANYYTESDLADSLKVLYNLPDATISNFRNEAGNSLTEYFNYGDYKTPKTVLYSVSVNGQTLKTCQVNVSVLDKLPPYCNDNDTANKKFQLVIDADPMTCKVTAEMVDAELAKHVNDATTHAMNDKIWFRTKAGNNRSVAGSGITSIVGNWDAMAEDGQPAEFPISDTPYKVYYKVADAAGNTRERTAYDDAAVNGVYPYCYTTVTVRKPSPTCGNPVITLPATDRKCRYDADEVFAELEKMESAGYVCGEERRLTKVTTSQFSYGVPGKFIYKVNDVRCEAQVVVASEKIECPTLSLKKVYDKKGLCNTSIADTAALYLKKALQDISDCRINAEYSYIPVGGLNSPVKENGIATYRFKYSLMDANYKLIDDACEATLVVADAYKPYCPSSSLNLIVPVGPDCVAIAGEAVDFFENGVASLEKGVKSSCSGSTLFADISAFKYFDETTKDEKIGGIIGDMKYDFDWNTSVPVLYRIASNSDFVNPNYCIAKVFVKDDSEIRCPDITDVNISTGLEGTALLPTAQLIAPLACRPNVITTTYTLITADGNGAEQEIDLAGLSAYNFAAGTYFLSAKFSREATEYQSASQKTCVQTIKVADGTVPSCPSISADGITLTNSVCSLDLENVKVLIETEIGKDKRLDNAAENAELQVADLSGELNIGAAKEGQGHTYTFNIVDKEGNSNSCSTKISLIDDEIPSCPESSNIDLTIGLCEASTEVTISGNDNCEIAKINWWCDENPKTEYTGSECTVKLDNLTAGSHILYWQLQDKAGNQQKGADGDFCSQIINVYRLPEIDLDCDESAKSFSVTNDCKMESLLDSLPLPIANVYSCDEKKDVAVPVAQYLLNGEIFTADELGEEKLALGDYSLTTIFICNATDYLLESKKQCTQAFTVEDKAKLEFSDNLSLSTVELLDAASLTVKINVVKPEVASCEPVAYSYQVGKGNKFEALTADYIEANVSKGETLITVKAESGKRSVETDLKIVVADTSVLACDNFTWRGVDYNRSQNVALAVGSNTERVDTIKILKLTVSPSKNGEFSATACESYTWNNQTYTESGDYVQSLQSYLGCDSVVTLHLTINRSYNVDTTAVACDAFVWYGDKYEVSGDYPRTFIAKSGCDSVVTLHLTINRSYKVDTTAVACDAFVWYGDKYETSGDYPRTFIAKSGCDSVVTLHLTINHSYNVDTTAVACDAFVWYGDKYEVSGSYPRTFIAKSGCDSVVTLLLTINRSYNVDTTAVACDAFVWYGDKYEVSGDYPRTFIAKSGCDSVVTLHLTINRSYKVDTTAVACDAFVWHGDKYEVSGEYPRTFIAKSGCDSIVTLHLTINLSYKVDTTAVACDAFVWYGDKYEVSGDYPRTFTSKSGCDSVVTLHLTINHSYNVDTTAVACDAFVWYGDKYEASGDYPRTFIAKSGCDSVVTLHLTVNRSYKVDTTAVACDAFVWYGDKYEASGDYPRTFIAKSGCDSIVTLYLTINRSHKVDTTAVACDAFVWYGDKYEVSGDYPRTFIAKSGCDSVVTLHLTINRSYKVDTTAAACDAFVWYGDKYEASGDYPRTFIAKSGCDSIVTLHLTINRSYKVDTTAVACDAFVWYGDKYEVSGDYPRTFIAKSGCDSVVTLHLTINRSYKVDTTAVACDAFVWYGDKYEASGEYPRTFTAKSGCDSVVTLHLTVNRSYKVDTTAVACDAFVWYGDKYEVSGEYPRTFIAKSGCDSVVTLHLTVNRSYKVDTTAVACDAFVWYGDKYEVSGDYPRTFIAKSGCDSVVTLHLTINPNITHEFSATACGSYTWNGQTYTESGNYVQTLQNNLGCDSVVTLHLVVSNAVHDTIRVTTCGSYTWHGTDYEVSGVYDYMDNTVSGCDSVEVLILTVNQPAVQPIYVYGCDNLYWRGHLYVADTDMSDTLISVYGCDSIVNYHLRVNKSINSSIEAVACNEYEWRGHIYTESGVYADTLQTIYGCDSILSLRLTINKSKETVMEAVACDSFVWHGKSYTNSGVYEHSLITKTGCDSIEVLHLTINSSVITQEQKTSCGSFVWHNRNIAESGLFYDTLQSATGCDSIIKLVAKVGYSTDAVYSDSVILGNGYHKYGFIISPTAIGHVGGYTFHHDLKSWAGCDSIVTLLLKVYKDPEIIVEDSIVEDLPVAPEGYSKPLDCYCVGDTVMIAYNLTSGVADSFSVSFNEELRSAGFLEASGLLSETQPYFVIPNAAKGGAYVAYLTLYNQRQHSNPIDVPFSVGLPNTVVERMWNDVVVCNRKGQDFVKYQWYKNGEAIEGATSQYYQDFETVSGSYGLTVWNSDGQRIDFCPRSFEELTAPYAFVVTPNPTKTNDVFEVLVRGISAAEMQYARLFVYNASGVLLETVTEVKEVNKMVLHNSGTYTIILNVNGGQVATSKVLVRP